MPNGKATPLSPGQAGAATPVLMDLALSEAPGMTPMDGVFGGQFEQGDVLEQPIVVEPGKQYTVIATSSGIAQLDIMLLVAAPPDVLAESSTQGPNAVLGPWTNLAPVGGPMQVVLRATRGSGMAAARVYEK